MAESWQSYANLVGGLGRSARERAAGSARSLLSQAGLEDFAMDVAERLAKLAEEIWQASRANRELLEKLIAAEADKAAARLGFVRSEEFEELRAEVAELRERIRATPQQPAATAPKSAGKRAPARKAAMKKAAETAAASG